MTLALPTGALVAAYWLVASPILYSPYWGDDMGNSQIPMQFALHGTSFGPWFHDQLNGWITGTGRFFPLSIAQAGAVFLTFTDRESYKAYQFVILAVTLVLGATLVGVVLRSWWAAVAGFGFELIAIQFKAWYDPYWQFHGQQELVASLAIASWILGVIAIRTRTRRSFALAIGAGAICVVGGGFTYESSIFLIAGFALLAVHEQRLRRGLWAMGVYCMTAGALLLNLLHYRSKVISTTPAYTVSLDPHLVKHTLLTQMQSALPLAYGELTRGSALPSNPSLPVAVPVALMIVIAFVAVMAVAIREVATRIRRRQLWAIGSAAVFWVVPSMFVAISARWQLEVAPGLGYLPVLFGAIAIGWLLTYAVSLIGNEVQRFGAMRQRPHAHLGGAVALGCALVAAAVLVVTASSNDSAVRFPPFATLQAQRDGFEHAVRSGLFDAVPPYGVVVRSVPDWWFWQNEPFAVWYGAPKTIRFIDPEQAATGACSTATPCFDLAEHQTASGSYTYSLAPRQ